MKHRESDDGWAAWAADEYHLVTDWAAVETTRKYQGSSSKADALLAHRAALGLGHRVAHPGHD